MNVIQSAKEKCDFNVMIMSNGNVTLKKTTNYINVKLKFELN